MTDPSELSDEELLTEYRHIVEFRTEESLMGQVSPTEIKQRQALENEILNRMDE